MFTSHASSQPAFVWLRLNYTTTATLDLYFHSLITISEWYYKPDTIKDLSPPTEHHIWISCNLLSKSKKRPRSSEKKALSKVFTQRQVSEPMHAIFILFGIFETSEGVGVHMLTCYCLSAFWSSSLIENGLSFVFIMHALFEVVTGATERLLISLSLLILSST